jgi:hypothetical protein
LSQNELALGRNDNRRSRSNIIDRRTFRVGNLRNNDCWAYQSTRQDHNYRIFHCFRPRTIKTRDRQAEDGSLDFSPTIFQRIINMTTSAPALAPTILGKVVTAIYPRGSPLLDIVVSKLS